MTSMTSVPGPSPTLSSTVRVALLGAGVPSAAALHATLDARPVPPVVSWDVFVAAPADVSAETVEIVLCEGEAGARAARAVRSAATVVALVAVRDDGPGTIAALDAGAHLCIRGDDPVVIAAYLKSIARRRAQSLDGDLR